MQTCNLGELSDHTIIVPTADPTGGLPIDATSLNTKAYKIGANTGKTSGTIIDINYTATVDGKTWTNLVRISPADPSVPLSKGGDTTVGFPIVDVLSGLEVKIANNPPQ